MPAPDPHHPGHPILWWNVKVLTGLLLIACVVARSLGTAEPRLEAPIWLGQLLVLMGGGIFLHHFVLYKRRRGRGAGDGELLTRPGLYRWVRHPMYLGDAILYLGLALLAGSAAALVLYGISLWALWRQARVEDRHMASLDPYAHRDWARHAGLLLPGLGRIR